VLFIYRYLAEENEIRDSLQCVFVSSNILRIQYPDGVKKESKQKDSGKVTIMFGDDPNNEGWLIRWTRNLEQTASILQNQVIFKQLFLIMKLIQMKIYELLIIIERVAKSKPANNFSSRKISNCHFEYFGRYFELDSYKVFYV
jgi:hypothetical protein